MKATVSAVFSALINAVMTIAGGTWPTAKATLVMAWNWSLGMIWNGVLVLARNPSALSVVAPLCVVALVYGHHEASVSAKSMLDAAKRETAFSLSAAQESASQKLAQANKESDLKIKALEAEIAALKAPAPRKSASAIKKVVIK